MALQTGGLLACGAQFFTAGVASRIDLGVGHAGLGNRTKLGRDVIDLDQLVEMQVRTDQLFLCGRRIESVIEVIVLVRGNGIDAATGAVIVGDHQSVG